jgi:uncharacterized repeat protein (TIGR03803 family)
MTPFRFDGRVPAMFAVAALFAGCAGGQSPLTPSPSANAARSAPIVVTGANAEQVLYSFSGQYDGGNAATGLVHDRHGNLYGTTVVGGTAACGTAFELTPQSSPPWRETVLHDFSCGSDGKNPHGGVTFDARGNLDGTTVAGGSGGSCTGDGCGVVFALTPKSENILHSFTGGPDGFGPGGGVVFDSAGDVFGTTPDGGKFAQGTVYEVFRSGGVWRERVIHAFTGGRDGGVGSLGLLLIDASGNLLGVTEIGGAYGAGTVFRMSRGAKGRWSFATLYAFKGTPDAGSPYGGLIADASGNLYGTTYYGGTAGMGTVFELTPRTRGGYRERVLYSFKGGSDGSSSTSTLILGGSGVLYGTTSAGGGTCDCGTIFKVNSITGKERVLHAFGSGTDGAYSYYGLTAGGHGVLYGTTVAGGLYNQGTVFEFKP